MDTPLITKSEDAYEIASEFIEKHAESIFPSVDVDLLESREQDISIWHAKPDGSCEEVESCRGPDWKACAVKALANVLWEARGCFNSNLAATA